MVHCLKFEFEQGLVVTRLVNGRLSMATKDTGIKDNRWFHQDKPGNDLAVLAMATSLVSFLVVLFLRLSTEAVVATMLLVVLLPLVVFLTQSKTTKIEIDREKSAVIKSTNYRVVTTRKMYPLTEFNQVKLLTADQHVEDGYRTIQYSVVLSGAGQSLELLSVDSENEEKSIQRELAEFLGGEKNAYIEGRY